MPRLRDYLASLPLAPDAGAVDGIYSVVGGVSRRLEPDSLDAFLATQDELNAAVIDAAATALPAAFAVHDEFTSRYFPVQFNIEHYGAVGDDSTNNLTAIRDTLAAALAAGGGIVLIPEGTFRVGVAGSGGALLEIPANTHVVGIDRERSVIKSMSTTAGHAVFTFDTVDSSSIRHVGITANAASNSSKAVYMETATNCVVDDCQISDGFGWGVFMSIASINCGVVDSLILGTTDAHGVEINGSSYCYVERTRFFEIGNTAGVSNAIELYDAAANRCYGNRIENNYISGGVGFAILGAGIMRTTIRGNVIVDPGSGAIGLAESGIDITRLSRFNVVSGNTITGANADGVGPSAAIVTTAYAVDNTITGNTVTGSIACAGIYMGGGNNVVSGNVCSLNGTHGILINSPATGCVVNDNTCNDNSVATANTYDGIQCGADFCSISGNTCSDTRGGSARQRFGVLVGSSNCAIIGNRGSGNLDAIGTVSDSGTDNTMVGNDAVLRQTKLVGYFGIFGAAPVAQPTVTGSRGGNAALASLLTGLDLLGVVNDTSTA